MEVSTAGTNSPVEEKKGISGYGLKMIAVVTMLIDHTAATILERILLQMQEAGTEMSTTYGMLSIVYFVMRLIGRMAFPIYCFLLVEGFHYTRNRAKYALRLFVFALISEVPFDMAFNQSFCSMSYNNVFLTLLIGLLTIWGIHESMARIPIEQDTGARRMGLGLLRTMVIVVILLAGSGLAQWLNTDYGACGIIAIFIMYMLYRNPMLGFGTMVLELGLLGGIMEWAAFLMLIPMHFYNGTRGKQIKYFFYAFYPVHLLVLSLICYAMGLGI